MQKILFVIAVCFLFLYPVFSQESCYELVWNDEFNYTGSPDSTKWKQEIGGNGWGNNELQYYTENRLENARVENGNLIIEARKETYGGRNYTSARLITYQNNHSWQYGKIEARIKLPYGQGIWPAFWMLDNTIFEGTNWPACGEIDILEMIGGGDGRDNTTHGTIHWADANNNHASYGNSKKLSEGIFADDFHVFGIEWDETSIKWFLDSVQFHEADITPNHLSEFHNKFFIILNMAVGGNWPGSPDVSTVFPQKMYVDYVRVYQLNQSPKIHGQNEVVKSQQGVKFSTVESDDFIYSWIVPDGATIIDGQGTNEISINWPCEPDTVYCNIISVCDTHNLVFPVKLKELTLQGLEVISQGDDLSFSVPLLANTVYTWEYSLNENLIFPDTNIMTLSWGSNNGFIKLSYENACGVDSVLKEIFVIKQLPYPDANNSNAIPGIIEATDYDSGGEGISYHDVDAQNQGNGPRQNESVDTETYGGQHSIGWTAPGEWYEYTIEVEKDTTYYLDAMVASTNNGGRFKLIVNGEDKTGLISVPNTSSWSAFKSLVIEDIELSTTDTILQVYIVNGEFNLRRLIISDTSFTSTNINKKNINQIKVYPTLVNDELTIENAVFESTYKIVNIDGKILRQHVLENNSIKVSELKEGFYLLIINQKGKIWINKFIKI